MEHEEMYELWSRSAGERQFSYAGYSSGSRADLKSRANSCNVDYQIRDRATGRVDQQFLSRGFAFGWRKVAA